MDEGTGDLTLGPSVHYDTGSSNAVAIDTNGNVVEVHVDTGRLFSRVGSFSP